MREVAASILMGVGAVAGWSAIYSFGQLEPIGGGISALIAGPCLLGVYLLVRRRPPSA